MKKTRGRLADGREIIYFDSRPDTVREAVDVRALAEPVSVAEMRYDALLAEWVGIAAHRQDRTYLPTADECPLCPSRPGRDTEVPDDDYEVVVFENRFPSFRTPAPAVLAMPGHDDALLPRAPALGRCEVVCFTSDHDGSFAELPVRRVRMVLDAWVDRTVELGRSRGVEQVLVFENRGREIGVTLSHPHGQIYAYPFVAPRTERMLASARRHWDRTRRNLFADVLAAELRAGIRIVARSEHWTAFVPSAARWPLEVHLYPHRRMPDLAGLSDRERDDFCGIYRDLLRRCDALYDQPLPYIAAWQQAPVRTDRELAYLHLQVFSPRRAPGRLKYLAGSESAAGVFLNDVLPEECARRLREVTPVRTGPDSGASGTPRTSPRSAAP